VRGLAVALVLCGLAFEASGQTIPSASEQPEVPRNAPGIDPRQHPENTIQPQQQGTLEQRGTAPAATAVPQSSTYPGERKGGADGKHSEEEGSEFWPALFGYRLKVTDTLIAAFTGLLFFATVALWSATRRLVSGAEQTAERQLRAYVFVEDGLIKGFRGITAKPPLQMAPGGNWTFIIQVDIKHYGQTPAHHLTTWFDADIRAAGEPRFTGAAQLKERSPLGPGSIRRAIPTKTLTPEQVEAVRKGDSIFWVWGRAEYVDVFGNMRWLEFWCRNGDAAEGEHGDRKWTGWRLQPDHYRTDEDE
jgi:hypothetical protein